jgi:hypothetical protein
MKQPRQPSKPEACLGIGDRELRVRNQLKAKGADCTLSTLKHRRKRLSNPYRTHANDLGQFRQMFS